MNSRKAGNKKQIKFPNPSGDWGKIVIPCDICGKTTLCTPPIPDECLCDECSRKDKKIMKGKP
jgi:hypothetical protein